MLPLTMIWFVAKRMPRFFAMLVDIVAIFLLIFLLVGNNNPSQSSTYLTSFRFSTKSPMYNIISTSFNADNETAHLEKVSIRAGYMGICIMNLPTNYSPQETLCYDRKNVSSIPLYQDLSVKIFNIRTSNSDSKNTTSTQATELNIMQLAQDNSVHLIHPYILMAVIVLALLMFCTTLCATIPKIPGKSYLDWFLLTLSPVLTLVWGLGAMWTNVAIRASRSYVPHASMGIITVKTGTKASMMAWFAFALLCVNCLILWALYFRDRRSLSDEIDKVKKDPTRLIPEITVKGQHWLWGKVPG
ncbi:LADA_0B07382g1_1 [Lachancea dasiensis]|uniref:LADA_0B07382g1_1 n=1 Tax=Lachancea dasiensis TaxID=1072105 RepID=A0A1G4IU37_9SACH|nr:LADA_0B07382g1_1 [Lachancea dasiensis]